MMNDEIYKIFNSKESRLFYNYFPLLCILFPFQKYFIKLNSLLLKTTQ